MTQTLNPSNKSALIALSGGNLIATMTTTDGVESTALGTTSVTTGKYYWETTIICVVLNSGAGPGIGNASTSVTTTGLGDQNNSIGWYGNSGVVWNNSAAGTHWEAWASGDVLALALDLPNGKIHGRVNAGNWNNIVGNDPATNTGGFVLPGTVTVPLFPGVSVFNTNLPDVATMRFASSSWTFAAPSGFGPFDVGVEAILFPQWPTPIRQIRASSY